MKVLEAAERVLGVGGKFRYLHQLEDRDDAVAFLEDSQPRSTASRSRGWTSSPSIRSR